MEHSRDCGFLIKQIADNIAKTANLALKNQDITISQLRFLELLYTKGREVPLKEAEAYFDVAQATIAGITSRLVKKGLIVLSPSPENHRAKLAALTEQGRLVYEAAMQSRDMTEQRILAPLSEAEAAEFALLLRKVSDGVKKT